MSQHAESAVSFVSLQPRASAMRIGVDLGGTKIEALALDPDGRELARHRIATPRDYAGSVAAIAGLVERLEQETGQSGTVGVGIPGTLRADGLVKNANSTWLNGQPLARDLSARLEREVRLANDANCFAISEATDGAAAGASIVFGVILGTGCGGGIALHGRVHGGLNGVAGEWGHTPLPWPRADEYPGPACYCGRSGCLERWIAGPGLERDFLAATGQRLTSREIVAACTPGTEAALTRYEDRLARGLATVAHVLDPDVFVLGGGMSQIARLYRTLPALVHSYAFGGEFATPIVPARFGDSSGVRGAAWLWPN